MKLLLGVPCPKKTPCHYQVVKSDSASVSIPELEFEIPAATQRGCITTVEGLLRGAGDALRELQPQRAQHDAAIAAAIDEFLSAPCSPLLKACSTVNACWAMP